MSDHDTPKSRSWPLPSDLKASANELVRSGGIPSADLLAQITADPFEASGLEGETYLGAASQAGATVERVHRVLRVAAL